ncbi:hypothetical protein QR680_013433 [Steinernema hermaphroditum]|uniref:Uncharacterized protein n=1 Tax=Steinernema hermaphroditum TaxID=289476 RepID=A0AA39I5I0_9BILA|nr:hypothetical protein QR680_013433 [Steinernema hermaphroditum]
MSEADEDAAEKAPEAEGFYVAPSKFSQVFPLEGNPDADLFFFDQPFHFSVGSEGRFIYTVGTDGRCDPTVPRLVVYDIHRGISTQYRTPQASPNTKLFHFYCIGASRALIISKTRKNATIVHVGAVCHRLKTLRLIRKLDEFTFERQTFWSTARSSGNSVIAFVCCGDTVAIKEYDFHGVVVDYEKNIPRSMLEFMGQPFCTDGKVHVFLSTIITLPTQPSLISVLDGYVGVIDLYSGELRFEKTETEPDKFPIIGGRMPNMVKHIHHNGHVWMIAKAGQKTRIGCFHVKTRKWHSITNWCFAGQAEYHNICMDVARDGKIVALCREHRYNRQYHRMVSAVKWIRVAYTAKIPRSLAMQAFTRLTTYFPHLRRENPLLLHRWMGVPKHFIM